MTKKATEQVLYILKHITNPNALVEESIAHLEAELAMFRRKGNSDITKTSYRIEDPPKGNWGYSSTHEFMQSNRRKPQIKKP